MSATPTNSATEPTAPAHSPAIKETHTPAADGPVFTLLRVADLCRYSSVMLRRILPEDAKVLDHVADQCMRRAKEEADK